MSDANFTLAVIWAIQNPGPILLVVGFLLAMSMTLLGMLLVDSA